MNLLIPEKYSEALKKFEEAVWLISQNKINKTNAFEHRIMDEINAIFSDQSFLLMKGENLWKKYSVAVDSVGKIYGYCVENIYGETFDLLGQLKTALPQKVNTSRDESRTPYSNLMHEDNIINYSARQNFVPDQNSQEYYVDHYFKKIANKVNIENCSVGLLNNLQINGNLDLMTGIDSLKKSFDCDHAEIDLSQLITYKVEELESLELLKDYNMPSRDIKSTQDFDFQSRSSEPEEIPEEPDYNSYSNSISQKLEKIVLFDDFDYIKPKDTPKIATMKQSVSAMKNKPSRPSVFLLSEEDVPQKLVLCENMISSAVLSKWKKDAPEIDLKEPFSAQNFYRLETRPFTIIKKSFVNSEISIPEHDDQNDFIIEEEPQEITATFGKFISMRDIKKSISNFVKIQTGNMIELNQLKNKTAEDISSSLFFAAVLHICNDFSLYIKSFDGYLYLVYK